MSGFGVAPQNNVIQTTTNAGFVRIGTQASLSVLVENVGDGNLSGLGEISNLQAGLALAGTNGDFSWDGTPVDGLSLEDGTNQVLNFLYSPTTRGPGSENLDLNFANGSSDGTNQAQDQMVTLTGNGVGPEFASSVPVGSTLDFGVIPFGEMGFLPLTITNNTTCTDGTTNPCADEAALTGLTLLGFSLTGLNPNDFQLLGFTPGTVLLPGQSINLQVKYNPLTLQDFQQAMLTFLTDQGTTFGASGQTFSFNLQGGSTLIPEPNSVAGLLALMGAGLFLPRNKKSQKKS